MDDLVFKVSEQIKTIRKGNNHVVIIGAGASKASCINKAEINGNQIPLMIDLVKVINLSDLLKDLPDNVRNKNFENVFSKLYEKEPNSNRLQMIEKKIYDYFSALKLPEVPTIYDYLVLSLRDKDLIATFNWDPFLWQAYERNLEFTKNLPQIAFLHGNVAIGLDEESKSFGPKGHVSLTSNKPFKPIKLLYPIKNKNYNEDPYIEDQWNLLSRHLKNPARVTIFGYSAPKSDVEAISIMKKAWGNPEKDKRFTQFEIIDIESEKKLTNSWKEFIFSHHYEITKDFFESSIVRFPRRTGEVFFENYLHGKFYEENYPPSFKSLQEMWKWYAQFIKHEN